MHRRLAVAAVLVACWTSCSRVNAGAAPSWSPSVAIAEDMRPGVVAFDERGSAWIGGTRYGPGGAQIIVTQLAAGAPRPSTVSLGAGSWPLGVAFDAAGEGFLLANLTVVPQSPVLALAMRPPGGRFGALVELPRPAGGGHLAVSRAGWAIVTWTGSGGAAGRGTVYAAVRSPGETFGPGEAVYSGEVGDVGAAINDRGAALVALSVGVANHTSELLVVRRSTAGAWTTPQRLWAGDRFSTTDVVLAFLPSGEALLAWSNSTERLVRAATAPPGSAFDDALVVSPNGVEEQSHSLSLAVNAAGAALLAWRPDPREHPGIAVAQRAGGATAFGPARQFTSQTVQAGGPVAAGLAADGAAFVAWAHGVIACARDQPGLSRIMAAVRPAGEPAFAAPTRIGLGTRSDTPLLAVADDGRALAVWPERGVRASVYRSKATLPSLPDTRLPPVSVRLRANTTRRLSVWQATARASTPVTINARLDLHVPRRWGSARVRVRSSVCPDRAQPLAFSLRGRTLALARRLYRRRHRVSATVRVSATDAAGRTSRAHVLLVTRHRYPAARGAP